MQVAVLGGGHGCYAAAVEMSEKGHQVRLWRRDQEQLKPVLESGCITVVDFKGERDVPVNKVTTDLKEAVSGADVILIPLPATVHEDLSGNLAPYLEEGQIVYLPPGTFGSYILARAMKDSGNKAKVCFAETGTLPYLARKHGPTKVQISCYATRLPTGVFPARDRETTLSTLKELYPVEDCGDILSGALMNAGPIIHPPLILMNAGPLEHFDTWDIHNEGTQPSIRKVTDALDAERICVREALGYGVPHFPLADHYHDERDEWMYGNAAHQKLTDSGDWREHINLQTHRYMLEDVATGLGLLVSVGRYAGVSTPIASGLLAMGSAIAGYDFYARGRTLENLELAGKSVGELQALLNQGFDD